MSRDYKREYDLLSNLLAESALCIGDTELQEEHDKDMRRCPHSCLYCYQHTVERICADKATYERFMRDHNWTGGEGNA